MLPILGFVLLIFGLLLDVLTIIWSHQTASGKPYKSGNFGVSVVCYMAFIFTTQIEWVVNNRLFIGICLVGFHLLAYFVIPIIFEKTISNHKK